MCYKQRTNKRNRKHIKNNQRIMIKTNKNGKRKMNIKQKKQNKKYELKQNMNKKEMKSKRKNIRTIKYLSLSLLYYLTNKYGLCDFLLIELD